MQMGALKKQGVLLGTARFVLLEGLSFKPLARDDFRANAKTSGGDIP